MHFKKVLYTGQPAAALTLANLKKKNKPQTWGQNISVDTSGNIWDLKPENQLSILGN